MTSYTTWQIIKKRWLYILSFIFIFILPAVIIFLKMITIRSNDSDVSISLIGFIVGMIYIAFVAKKLRHKIRDMKLGMIKIFVTGLSNIIPFVTIGFLIIIVEKALKGADLSVWAICASMLIGSICQMIEFTLNRKFIYFLKIDELAREKLDVEKRQKELESELTAEDE